MENWFSLSEDERKVIITQTSADIGLPPAAIEKDFWVAMVLQSIFKLEYSKHFVFKGGTSLSKGWGIIERFSEDIDLAIDRSFLGFADELSAKEVTPLRKASCKFVNEKFIQHLEDVLLANGIKDFEVSVLEFERSDTDPVAIEVKYKSITEANKYLQPRVLIEISARSLKDPFENRSIRSFIGDKYPEEQFSDKPMEIPTVVPTRTLLEKIFLLHEEFQKPENRPINSIRMTRHLYDIGKIMDTQFLEVALTDKDLYEKIVKHRELLTKVTWVDYSTHFPPNLNFIPPDKVIAEWERDYKEMQESMFYGSTDKFEDLISKLRLLQKRINS